MNILFMSGYNINPFDGGIARITKTLADLFVSKGHCVWYLGYRKISEDEVDRQLYFPTKQPKATQDNMKFLETVIGSKAIDVVIVQKNPCKDYLMMLQQCKINHKFLIISCFHNLILTPTANFAYSKERQLKKKRLGFVFSLLQNKIVKNLLLTIYIIKNRPLYNYIVDSSDITVVLGEGHRKELLKMIGCKKNNDIHVVPNCVEPSERTCDGDKDNVVVWIGNVDCSVKRIDYMIDVWSFVSKKHPDWSLLVLGDGPSLEEMKREVCLRQIPNVKFEGRVVPDKYYDRAKIICVTSVHESFSLVTIEAKMRGVVPVVQDCFPMAHEIVCNGTDGILVNAFNIDDYRQKLSTLLGDEDTIQKLSEEAKERSKIYTPEVIYKKWELLLNKVHKIN